jgi:cyanophycin synthetase
MVESSAWGGFDEDVTASIHPDNLDIALRATVLFNLQVTGIDIITPAIDTPWHENGAIINEVNFAPLLGGGDISRSHVPEFIDRLIDDNGRIPIEAIIGGATALKIALTRQKEMAQEQVSCFITSHEMTLTATGVEMQFPFNSLTRRCQALLMDRRVDAILLVVQTDELLRSGLPLDRIKCCTVSGDALKQVRSRDARKNLLALLRSYASHP